MRYVFLATAVALIGFGGNARAASPIYLTTSAPLADVGYTSNDTFTFIAPYFAKVKTKISVSITKASNSSNSTGAPADSAPKQPSPPNIYLAASENGYAVFAVSCDLTSVLNPQNSISVVGVNQNAFNGQHSVIGVTANTVTATQNAGSPPGQGGMITSVNCPAAKSSASSGALSVALSVAAVPVKRAYLYLRKDAFFADTINVSVGNDGLLSSSDSASQQQISAIISELAQTIGLVGSFKSTAAQDDEIRKSCFQDLNTLVQPGSYYAEYLIGKNIPAGGLLFPIYPEKTDQTPPSPGKPVIMLEVRPLVTSLGEVEIGSEQEGLVAFFPIPAQASVVCGVVQATNKQAITLKPKYYLNSPMIVSLYTESHFLDPQRDFLTGPQDTLTFSSGFIVGHKYSDQSPARTIVDTVTAPIRALVPSVSMTQTTSVTSTGTRTNTTSTTTGAPKGP